MNTRLIVSVALAVGILFASPPSQAQAPTAASRQQLQGLQGQIVGLQAQVNQLQAQVKRLQAQLRAQSQLPTGFFGPSISPFNGGSITNLPTFQVPNSQFQKPLVVTPQPYWNIPPCQVTLLKQATP